jgi:hypothetical protein
MVRRFPCPAPGSRLPPLLKPSWGRAFFLTVWLVASLFGSTGSAPLDLVYVADFARMQGAGMEDNQRIILAQTIGYAAT